MNNQLQRNLAMKTRLKPHHWMRDVINSAGQYKNQTKQEKIARIKKFINAPMTDAVYRTSNQQSREILLEYARHWLGKTMAGRGKKTRRKRNKKQQKKGGFSFGSLAGCAEDEILAHGSYCPISYKLNPLSNPIGCCVKKIKPVSQLGGKKQKGGALIEIKREDLGKFVGQDIFIEIGWKDRHIDDRPEEGRWLSSTRDTNFNREFGFHENLTDQQLDKMYYNQWQYLMLDETYITGGQSERSGNFLPVDKQLHFLRFPELYQDDDNWMFTPWILGDGSPGRRVAKIKGINLHTVGDNRNTIDYIYFSDFESVDHDDLGISFSAIAATALKKIQEYGRRGHDPDNMLDIHWFYEDNSPFYIKFFLSTSSYLDIKNSTKRAITHKLRGDQNHYFEPGNKEQSFKQQLAKQYNKRYKKLRNQGLTKEQAVQHSRRGRGVQLPGSAGGLWNEKATRRDIPQNILDMLVPTMDKKIKESQQGKSKTKTKKGGKKKKSKKTRRKRKETLIKTLRKHEIKSK